MKRYNFILVGEEVKCCEFDLGKDETVCGVSLGSTTTTKNSAKALKKFMQDAIDIVLDNKNI
jgi:hypothetical protein